MICKSYTEANSKSLKYDITNKSNSYIIYLHAKNLYGQSMIKFVPNEMLD